MSSKSALKSSLSKIAAAVAVGAAALGAAASVQAQGVLNVYNWAEYIAEDTLENFTKETGIEVRYDTFDSNETLHARLVAGRTGYDIVVPSSNWARLQIRAGIYQPLNKALIPNLANLDPIIQDQLSDADPGNEHLVVWLWGYQSVGVNVDKVKEALGDLPMPENSYELIFNPQYAERLASCGISVLDSATDFLPDLLSYLGKDPFTQDPADYDAALEHLRKIRPHIRVFSSSGYIEQFARGELCVVQGYSGDINISRDRAIEVGNGVNIQGMPPKSGGQIFFDVMAIPKDAQNVENAHKFIDYILRPEVHASLTNYVFYANPNPPSKQFVVEEVANDPTVFLDSETLARMIAPGDVEPIRRLMSRTFQSFKTGR